MTANLNSPQRQLIALRIEHADLDAIIDRLADQTPLDQLTLQRMKKRRLALRDHIARLEAALDPREPA
ncbi:YdcH family protein [Ottowia sp. SB7-C50]|uniref:YdcH family protein n=1 Tax=Ottowia sp. SB7-C50 TaxID=3081231 RepID=UPI002954E5C0|nr:YdcH family protein [Ottowia sp. SB7-C50]WOP14564.1 YdcH family protein [Ottowia sp. SB7-C50]